MGRVAYYPVVGAIGQFQSLCKRYVMQCEKRAADGVPDGSIPKRLNGKQWYESFHAAKRAGDIAEDTDIYDLGGCACVAAVCAPWGNGGTRKYIPLTGMYEQIL